MEDAETESDPVIGPTMPPQPSLEQKVDNLERRLKLAAAVISVVALAAPIGASVAAWMSWRTAKASEGVTRDSQQLARDVADKAGASLQVSRIVFLSGECGNPANPLIVHALVQNSGHMAGKIRGISLHLGIEPTPEQDAAHPNSLWTTVVGENNTEVVVNPQDSAKIEMPIDCKRVADQGLDPSRALDGIIASVNDRSRKWYLHPLFAFNSPIDQLIVESAYSLVPNKP